MGNTMWKNLVSKKQELQHETVPTRLRNLYSELTCSKFLNCLFCNNSATTLETEKLGHHPIECIQQKTRWASLNISLEGDSGEKHNGKTYNLPNNNNANRYNNNQQDALFTFNLFQ